LSLGGIYVAAPLLTKKEKMTNFAPFERILLSVFTFALLLNGLNPWLIPADAKAKENVPLWQAPTAQSAPRFSKIPS